MTFNANFKTLSISIKSALVGVWTLWISKWMYKVKKKKKKISYRIKINDDG